MTLFRIINAAAPITIVVGHPRIATIVTPAVASSREWSGLDFLTYSFTRGCLVNYTVISIVQTAVHVVSTIWITIADPMIYFLWLF